MRLTSILGGFLLLRSLACALPSPLPKDVAIVEEEEGEEGFSHLETRGKGSQFAKFCLRKLHIGGSSSSQPEPVVPLDTEITQQLTTMVDTYLENIPPFAVFHDIIGTQTVRFQAFNYQIGGSPRSTGVLFLRNDGDRTRHVSLLRNPPLGQAGLLDECIDTYELPPHSTSEAHEFPRSASYTYQLRLND
ncbi:hypothetical protein Tdes44962_MAKER00554 [Teratosphaeria destructans]|uniref:Uncharacterized protein n=1 Tax=Teratosphaeria destructans TaxID=418781 RepID=A0A9W7SQC6_9PEZI|nr:hypothetical protein Tdes44962_MAKER00554 [Teratosphaeria destructans]